MLAVLTTGTLESAMAPGLTLAPMTRARRIRERLMSLTSRQSAQRREAGTHGMVDRSRNRATATAAVTDAHAGHAIGIGHDIEAAGYAPVLIDVVADGRTAGHAGELTIAQFGAVE